MRAAVLEPEVVDSLEQTPKSIVRITLFVSTRAIPKRPRILANPGIWERPVASSPRIHADY